MAWTDDKQPPISTRQPDARAAAANRASTPLLAVLLVAVAIGITRNVATAYGPHSEWSVGEWLINYAGGFVRRGLPGSVIHLAAVRLHISPITSAVVISLVSYALLLAIVFRRARQAFLPATLISPVVAGAPALGDFLVRKDAFVLVLYAVALEMVFAAGRSRGLPRRAALVGGANAAAVTAVLSHESFAFFGIPSLILLAARRGGRYSLGRGVLLLLPTLAAFGAVVTHIGNAEQAAAIHDSWQHLPCPLPPSRLTDPRGPQGAIWYLRHTAVSQIAPSAARLVFQKVDQGIFWEPVMWLITVVVAVWLLRVLPSGGEGRLQTVQRARVFRVLWIQALCIGPLFCFTYDWGRWIFLGLVSSVLLAPFGRCVRRALQLPVEGLRSASTAAALHTAGREDLQWLLLAFGNPGWSWEAYRFVLSTPIGELLDSVLP